MPPIALCDQIGKLKAACQVFKKQFKPFCVIDFSPKAQYPPYLDRCPFAPVISAGFLMPADRKEFLHGKPQSNDHPIR